MKNKGFFKTATALLAALVLLGGFSVTAYAGGGEDIPTQQVQERFWSLDREHLQYVFDCLRRNTTQIFNIRAYLLTSLYNAPVTISSFNRTAVQHDFGL